MPRDKSPRRSESAGATISRTTSRPDEVAELRSEMAKLTDLVKAFVTQKSPAPAAEPELVTGANCSCHGRPINTTLHTDQRNTLLDNGASINGQAGTSVVASGNTPIVPATPDIAADETVTTTVHTELRPTRSRLVFDRLGNNPD